MKFSYFGRYLAYLKRIGVVTIKAVHKHATVYRQDVAFLKRRIIWDTVYYLGIRRYTEVLGETVHSKERGFATIVADIFAGKFIQVIGCSAGFYFFCQQTKGLRNQLSTLAHQPQFGKGFQMNHSITRKGLFSCLF